MHEDRPEHPARAARGRPVARRDRLDLVGFGAGDPHLVGWNDRRRAERFSRGETDVAARRQQREEPVAGGLDRRGRKARDRGRAVHRRVRDLEAAAPGVPVRRVHRDAPGPAGGVAVRRETLRRSWRQPGIRLASTSPTISRT